MTGELHKPKTKNIGMMCFLYAMNKNRNAVACFKMEVGNIQMMLKLVFEMMMKLF